MSARKRRQADREEQSFTPLPISEADKALFGAIAQADGTMATANDDGTLQIGRFTLTPTGLRVSRGATREEWEDVGKRLRSVGKAWVWLVADWMAYGQRQWKVTFEDASLLVGRSVKTLYNWSSIAQNVDISRRREKLDFSHHAEVAKLNPEDQTYWLTQADAKSRWSVSKLSQAIEAWLSGAPPTPSTEVDPYGAKNFNRNARRVARMVDRVGAGGQLNPKEIEKTLRNIEIARAWLEQAETMIRQGVDSED